MLTPIWKLPFVAILLSVLMAPVFGAPLSADEKPRVEDVSFSSHGVELSGSLVFPSVGSPRAAVVFIHGSGKQTRNLHWAERFAAAGIAALVYDKRGAGQSGGVYEEQQSVSGPNIELLSDDTAAAVR